MQTVHLLGHPITNVRPGVDRGPKDGVVILVREGVADEFVAGVGVRVTKGRERRVRDT